MEKSKKIILIIIVLLLVILVLALGAYIIYDKVLGKEDNLAEASKKTMAPKQYTFKEVKVKECFEPLLDNEEEYICEEKIKVDNKSITIKVVTKTRSDVTSGYLSELFINNKKIYSPDSNILFSRIFTIDNNLIFEIGGYEGYRETIKYSLNSSKLSEIIEFDKEIPDMNSGVITKIVKNKAYFYDSRLAENWFGMTASGHIVDLCSEKERQKYGVNEDTIISGLYEMEYLGQDKYIITRVQEETIRNVIHYQSINDYCIYELGGMSK